MEEVNIEIKSEKARTLVGRMPSFYTNYGIIIITIILFALVSVFCQIKVTEIICFPVNQLPGSNIAYISIPVKYELSEQMDSIIITDGSEQNFQIYEIYKIIKNSEANYLFFMNANPNMPDNAYANIPIRRYTFFQCLNTPK